MASVAEELVGACVAAAGAGADFPTVWTTILKGHPFVAGAPIQRLEVGNPLLEVPLISGQRIVVGPGPRDYGLAFGRGSNAAI